MKDFKNIFATQLDLQEKHFGKKKSLVNCNSFQIHVMAAKHCSGCCVADITMPANSPGFSRSLQVFN